MAARRAAEQRAPRRAEWEIPAADVFAGGAEVVRLQHAALPVFTWGRRVGGAWVAGPAPFPRQLPEDLTDAEHAGFLVRLAGLLSFLAAHGLGLSTEGVRSLGTRPGGRDVPWLAAAPVPAWRAVPAPVALGVSALRLAGRDAPFERPGEARRGLEEALEDGLPARSAETISAVLRAGAGARPSDALLLDLARTGEVGEKVALDLLGLVVPRELAPVSGDRFVAAGAAAEWVARGAARREPGEAAFAEAGPPASMEDGAPLVELADALGPDPRGAALRMLARGESPVPQAGPPLVLLARDLERWDERSIRAWEELPRFLGPLVRIETRAEAPPPWQSLPLLVPRLGREEVSGLVHLPYASPAAFARLWEVLAAESAGEPVRFLRSARQRARAFLASSPRVAPPRRAVSSFDVVLRACALLGAGFSAAEAAAVAGASADRTTEALEMACDAGTVVRSPRGSYRFTDEGLRRRLSSGLGPAEVAAGLSRLGSAGTSPLRLLLARLSREADSSNVDAARGRLVEAHRSGRTEEVEALLGRAPAASPDFGEPLVAVEAHASAGRFEAARAAAARVDAGVARAEPRERREAAARVLARLGEPEKALSLLPGSGDVDERLARAGLLLRLRREGEAATILEALGAVEARHAARAHLLRAELHERRQELPAAEAELAAVAVALERSPGGAGVDAGFTAGYLALGLGRPREARAFFRTARDEAREPSRRADALFDLSVAAAGDGALAEAEASLEEALALFSALGERDRYLTALGQRAALALLRSDARAARRDLETVLAHDRMPDRAFQRLFSIPLRQRLDLAEGDDADGAEAFAESVPPLELHAEHPARREILVLEGARLLAAGLASEALDRLEEAGPLPDARAGVEPLRARLVASARLDLGRAASPPPLPGSPGRALFEAEEALARGRVPPASSRLSLSDSLEKPGGPLEVAARLLEWRGRFPGFFATEASAPFRELGLRAARRAGLEGTAARLPVPAAAAAIPGAVAKAPPNAALVAEDASTREVFDTVRRVAPHRISVLVLGESGTGKELVAREVHLASGRTGPFVAVNVAALPETLAEAELFGAARGAYTGADRDRTGVIEASSGGTLFLDEIGDLSPQVQAKLLRVLQEREVRRLGETKTRSVDLRLVAATHRDLARLAAEGRFRGDLLYRLAGITVSLPPLRERPRDLRVLLERAFAGTPLAPDARAALLSWSWPGNVRELLSAVEAAKAMAGPGARVERGHLPPRLRAAKEPTEAGAGRYRRAVEEAKRGVILATLAEAGGNRTKAAALLGLSRQSLLYEIRRLAITD